MIQGITFSECQSNTFTQLRDLTVNSCTFLGKTGHTFESLLTLNTTNIIFKICSLCVINTVNKESLSEAALISHASNVTVEASKLAVQQGSVLLAEAESTIHIINTLISNSTTRKVLIHITIGQLFIEESKIVQNKEEMIIYARQCKINISNSSFDNNEAANSILCIVKSSVFLNDILVSGNRGNFSIVYLLKTGTNITGKTIF